MSAREHQRSGPSTPETGPEAGTVSVELVGTLPLLLLLVLAVAQIGIAGYTLWSAGTAARAGARAVLTGHGPRGAASRSLPPVLRPGLEVKGGNPVRVGVRVPRLLPLLPPVTVSASSSLAAR